MNVRARMSWFTPTIDLIVLALGAFYLYYKHQRRVGNWPRRRNREKWIGHGLETSQLKPRVEQVRRDPLAARQATRGVWSDIYSEFLDVRLWSWNIFGIEWKKRKVEG